MEMGTDVGTVTHQKSTQDQAHVMELSRAAVPCGTEDGYIVRKQSQYAMFGCTCGRYSEGPAVVVTGDFNRHAHDVGVIENG